MARGKSSDNNKQVFWIILALVIAVLLFGGFLTKEQVTVEAGGECNYRAFNSLAWGNLAAKRCEELGCEVTNKEHVDDPSIADDEGYWFWCAEKKYCATPQCARPQKGCVSVYSNKTNADGCPAHHCLTVCEGANMDKWCSKITGGDNGNGDNGNGDNGNGGPTGGGPTGGGGDSGGFGPGPGPGDGGGGGGFDM